MLGVLSVVLSVIAVAAHKAAARRDAPYDKVEREEFFTGKWLTRDCMTADGLAIADCQDFCAAADNIS